MLCSCTSTLPHQVQAGGSFVSAFDPGSSASMAFSSTFGGPDRQRDPVLFVLCPATARLCDVSTPFQQGSGVALETQFMTRMAPDPFSPAGLRGRIEARTLGLSMPLPGAAMAMLRIPRRDQGGPTPGRYRVEARVLTPKGTEDLLRGSGPGVEILDGVGEPTALPVPISLAQIVPLPRITLTVASRSAGRGTPPRPGPAAAEIVLRYPDAKVEIRGAAEVGALGPQSMLSVAPGPDPGTVRVSLLAPRGETRQIGLAFASTARDPAPVGVDEFEILEQRLYDERGAVDDSIRFEVEPVIR